MTPSLRLVRHSAPLRLLRGTLVAHPPALDGGLHSLRVRVPRGRSLHCGLRLTNCRVVDSVHAGLTEERVTA